jgi:hypothetical protein
MAVWRGVELAFEGKPLPATRETPTAASQQELYFPDLWSARIWRIGHTLLRIIDIILVSAMLIIAWTCSVIAVRPTDEQHACRD